MQVLSNIETKKKKRYDVGYYSVTINPDDKHQFCGRLDRYEAFRQFMYERLLVWNDFGIEYKFCIEASDVWDVVPLSTASRLHLHGIIYLKTHAITRNWLLHIQYQLSRFSYINIDTIDNPTVWIEYCEKQKQIMGNMPLCSNENLFQECIDSYQGVEDGAEIHGDGVNLPQGAPIHLTGSLPSSPKKKTRRRFKGNPLDPAPIKPSNILLDFNT